MTLTVQFLSSEVAMEFHEASTMAWTHISAVLVGDDSRDAIDDEVIYTVKCFVAKDFYQIESRIFFFPVCYELSNVTT